MGSGRLKAIEQVEITGWIWHPGKLQARHGLQDLALGHAGRKRGSGSSSSAGISNRGVASLCRSQVRKSFRDELRGTFRETLQNLFHWVLCVLFIAETIGAVAYLTEARSLARDSPEESTMGLPNTVFVLAAKSLGPSGVLSRAAAFYESVYAYSGSVPEVSCHSQHHGGGFRMDVAFPLVEWTRELASLALFESGPIVF